MENNPLGPIATVRVGNNPAASPWDCGVCGVDGGLIRNQEKGTRQLQAHGTRWSVTDSTTRPVFVAPVAVTVSTCSGSGPSIGGETTSKERACIRKGPDGIRRRRADGS